MTPETQTEIVRLRAQGFTLWEIGRKVSYGVGAVAEALARDRADHPPASSATEATFCRCGPAGRPDVLGEYGRCGLPDEAIVRDRLARARQPIPVAFVFTRQVGS